MLHLRSSSYHSTGGKHNRVICHQDTTNFITDPATLPELFDSIDDSDDDDDDDEDKD